MHRCATFYEITKKNSQKGISLLEILIVLSIIGLVTTAIYSTYRYQLKLFISQSQVQEMQQTLRGVMDIIVFDLRMAGYEQKTGANAGFVNPPGIPFTVAANHGEIRFTADIGECDPSKGCHPGVIDEKEAELIGYKLEDNVIRRFSPGSVTWQPLAENIEALDFVYLDKDRNRLGDHSGNITTASDYEKIRSVQVTIVGRSAEKAPVLSLDRSDGRSFSNLQGNVLVDAKKDQLRRMAISAEIRLRNWRI